MTPDQFKACFPANPHQGPWTDALNEAMSKYAIDANPLRICQFLAQCGHESRGFTATVENLNYSADALLATWPSRFTAETAAQYARKPEAIANKVYANRMGNGDEASGDGWKYRGAGAIQITGHDNHMAFVAASGQPFGYIHMMEGAAMSAAWFWDLMGLNKYADQGDTLTVTKKINGGTNGLADRVALYKTFSTRLGGHPQ